MNNYCDDSTFSDCDSSSCIPEEEVMSLLKKCAKELGFSFGEEYEKEQQEKQARLKEVQKVMKIKKWLNSSKIK